MADPSSLAERLRWLRTEAGVPARALSLAAGASHAFVYHLEEGLIDDPSARILHGIADALGVSPTWLLTGEGETPDPKCAARSFAAVALRAG